MFWEVFERLCASSGKSPNAVAKELGFSSGSITAWKKGTEPRNSAMKKIADYFDVSVDCFFDENEKTASVSADGLSATRYSQLSEENQALVDALIEKLLNSQSCE